MGECECTRYDKGIRMISPEERSAAHPEGVLADAILKADYQSESTYHFPSPASLDWFIRRHRTELFQRGAVLEIGGRIFVVKSKFNAAVLELGSVPRKTSRCAA